MNNKEKFFAETYIQMNNVLFCPRIKLHSSITLELGVVYIGVLLSVFGQQLRPKNANSPKAVFLSLDCAQIPLTVVFNEINQPRKRCK